MLVPNLKTGLMAAKAVVPGLEELSETEKIACVALGVLDYASSIGMVQRRKGTALTGSGRVHFDRLLLKMKSVPPPEKIAEALRKEHPHVSSSNDLMTVAKTAHKILSMGLMEAFHDYQGFRERRAAERQDGKVGSEQPTDDTPAKDEA